MGMLIVSQPWALVCFTVLRRFRVMQPACRYLVDGRFYYSELGWFRDNIQSEGYEIGVVSIDLMLI